MAGYLFLLGEIKDANDKVIKNANAIYNEVFSTGTYSTRMHLENTLKAGNWSQSRAKQSTFTDYLGMKENDDKSLPGSPDIAIQKYHIAIFIDGEFWHGQNWDERKKKLKHNREYWVEKIEENITRDIRNDKDLQARDWVPVHFWEKEVLKNLDSCIASIEEIVEVQRELLIDGKEIELYDQGDEIVEYGLSNY